MVDRGVFSDVFNPLTFVDEKVRSFVTTKDRLFLDADFEPASWSVICGRGNVQVPCTDPHKEK